MEGQYSDKVMEHFRNPHNVGDMPDADGIGHVGNPVCVPPGTLIYANTDATEIKNLTVGQKVLSDDGIYHQITEVKKRTYNGYIYSIGVHNLGTTVTTPEHNILALKMNEVSHKHVQYKKFLPDWHKAEELKKGDVIIYPVPKEEVGKEFINFEIEKPKWDFKSKELPKKIKVDTKFLRLIGYYLSEGHVRTDKSKGTLGFTFGSSEKEYADEVINLVRGIFNIEPAETKIIKNAIQIVFYSARLARFFETQFGKGALNKHIPHWMTLLPVYKQKEIICGLWRGDGYVNSATAKFVTISEKLAYQVRVLLLRQKIIFSFLEVPQQGIHKKNFHLYVKEDDSIKKLSEITNIPVTLTQKKRNPHKSWYDENFYYVPIKKIGKIPYKGKVLNLEVEGAHTFVSNSMTLHNCGDIMELYIKVRDNIIVDAKFKTFGCGAAISTSSMVTDLVKGKSVEEALKISNRAVAEALGGLPKIKMHCSVLAEEALKSAIDDYFKKHPKK